MISDGFSQTATHIIVLKVFTITAWLVITVFPPVIYFFQNLYHKWRPPHQRRMFVCEKVPCFFFGTGNRIFRTFLLRKGTPSTNQVAGYGNISTLLQAWPSLSFILGLKTQHCLTGASKMIKITTLKTVSGKKNRTGAWKTVGVQLTVRCLLCGVVKIDRVYRRWQFQLLNQAFTFSSTSQDFLFSPFFCKRIITSSKSLP